MMWPFGMFTPTVKAKVIHHISIQREPSSLISTLGIMFINDVFECDTLEDVVRAPGVKIPGETAIPTGTYQLVIDFSQKFRRLMPHVLNVPMFDGIRIHWGNKSKDTEGCILVGTRSGPDFISHSIVEFNAFYDKLDALLETGSVWLTIDNAKGI